MIASAFKMPSYQSNHGPSRSRGLACTNNKIDSIDTTDEPELPAANCGQNVSYKGYICVAVVVVLSTGSLGGLVWNAVENERCTEDLNSIIDALERRLNSKMPTSSAETTATELPLETILMTQTSLPVQTSQATQINQIPYSSFRLLQTKAVRYDNVDFLALQVEVPSDGQSKTKNWCRDYQYLCDYFSKQPAGCGGSELRVSPFKECIEMYNSYMDPDGVLRCSPTFRVAYIANKAFPGMSPPPTQGYNAFGFFKCKEYCQKSIKASNSSLSSMKGFWENGNNLTRIMYTVCR